MSASRAEGPSKAAADSPTPATPASPPAPPQKTDRDGKERDHRRDPRECVEPAPQLNVFDVPENMPGARANSTAVQREYFYDRAKNVYKAEEKERRREDKALARQHRTTGVRGARLLDEDDEECVQQLGEMFPQLEIVDVRAAFVAAGMKMDVAAGKLLEMTDGETVAAERAQAAALREAADRLEKDKEAAAKPKDEDFPDLAFAAATDEEIQFTRQLLSRDSFASGGSPGDDAASGAQPSGWAAASPSSLAPSVPPPAKLVTDAARLSPVLRAALIENQTRSRRSHSADTEARSNRSGKSWAEVSRGGHTVGAAVCSPVLNCGTSPAIHPAASPVCPGVPDEQRFSLGPAARPHVEVEATGVYDETYELRHFQGERRAERKEVSRQKHEERLDHREGKQAARRKRKGSDMA